MSDSFGQALADYQRRVEATLERQVNHSASLFSTDLAPRLTEGLHQAMAYSSLQGGKRIRPALVYAAANAVGHHSPADIDLIAAAVECLHCYSLVHDDLPAMDDDDLRRGQATCHRHFDEATAILAGDGLQTLAFELLTNTSDLSSSQQIRLVTTLAKATGARGMVGGQFMDLQAEDRTVSLDELESIHQLKTGALIRAALQMGGIAADANQDELAALDRYGRAIGLAFQVKDDLLDIEATTAELGKPQGSDLARNKSTYPALLGMEPARQYCNTLYQQALDSLKPFADQGAELSSLATFIIERNH